MVAEVVIVGGGTMGAGIAQNLLEVGSPVTIVEVDDDAAKHAFSAVAQGLAQRFKRDPNADENIGALLEGLATTADAWPASTPALVIEAVPESADLKVEVLRRIETTYPELELLGTNTSSLSIDSLASRIERPERFIGMHFFNPVPRSELVELVVGTATDASVIAAAEHWVKRLGKESIVVHDSPGFATSRLGVALGLEAIRMLEQGVAVAADIDLGMTLGYKHPMGPLRLTDLVGLDVRLHIAEYLATELGPRFEPPHLLRAKVAAGDLGKKTGQGFYSW